MDKFTALVVELQGLLCTVFCGGVARAMQRVTDDCLYGNSGSGLQILEIEADPRLSLTAEGREANFLGMAKKGATFPPAVECTESQAGVCVDFEAPPRCNRAGSGALPPHLAQRW